MKKLIALEIGTIKILENIIYYMKDRLEYQERLDPYKDNTPYIKACVEYLQEISK